MKLIRYILSPFVLVYYFVTWLRNMLFDIGLKTSTEFNFPVICVGNLSVGGTGKTPMIEFLIDLLKDKGRLATLSRGYKRNSKGFILANNESTAASIGDEPFQFYNKFKSIVKVAVDANRTRGINKLRTLEDKPNIILLDDAFQHRKVKCGFNILLTTFDNPYFSDYVLPLGNLRESRLGANRADVIVITKCPENLSSKEKAYFAKRISPKAQQHVFFSSISYSHEVFSDTLKLPIASLEGFTLVTGIANAQPLVNFLNKKGLKFDHLNFQDHHMFSDKEINDLENKRLIITTEKDYMRLKGYKTLKNKVFYLPIKMVLDKNETFENLLNDFIKTKL